MMICNLFDVVEVPFPFSDVLKSKKRKALVISSREFNADSGNSVLMMITSATNSAWKSDIHLTDLETAGLKKSCFCRLKFFTLDNRMILEKVGTLSAKDSAAVKKAIKAFMV
jgi:mRNA interferase MazF